MLSEATKARPGAIVVVVVVIIKRLSFKNWLSQHRTSGKSKAVEAPDPGDEGQGGQPGLDIRTVQLDEDSL